jgi:hypothetical protein
MDPSRTPWETLAQVDSTYMTTTVWLPCAFADSCRLCSAAQRADYPLRLLAVFDNAAKQRTSMVKQGFLEASNAHPLKQPTSPPLAIQSTGGCRAPDRPPRVPLSLPSISPDGRLLLSHATYPSLQTVPETLDHTPHIISTVPVPHHAHVLCCTPQISFHRRHKSYRDDPRTRGYAKVIQNTRFALAPASQPKTSSDPSQGTAGGKGCMNGSSML